jgi:integrase
MKDWTNRYLRIVAPAGFDGYDDRKTYYFKTKNAAAEFRTRIKRWKLGEKLPPTDTLEFSDTDKRWLSYLRAELGTLDSLPEILSHWKSTAKTITNPLTVAELGKQYLAYRATLDLSKHSKIEDKFVIGRITARLGKVPAHQVTEAQIRDFLATGKSHSIKRKLYKVGSLLFDYARQEKALMINPFSEFDRPKVTDSVTGILSVDVFSKLLGAADKEFPALLPYIALAGFAGIRREELVREYAADQVLQWSDIDWEKKRITVRHEVAKRTKRKSGDLRLFEMEPALIHWLEPYRQPTGNIVSITDSNFRKQYARLCAKVGHKPLRNELRHSHATYALARGKNQTGRGALAIRMGNSESTLNSNYLAKMLTPEDGKAWFALRRKGPVPAGRLTKAKINPAQIIALPAAA